MNQTQPTPQVRVVFPMAAYFKLLGEVEGTIAEVSKLAAASSNPGYLDERLANLRIMRDHLYSSTETVEQAQPQMPTDMEPQPGPQGLAGESE